MIKQVIFAAAIVVIGSVAYAQTGADLLIKPWAPGERLEVSADVTILPQTNTDQADDFQLTYYESSGRLRLFPAERADPRFGYHVSYLDIHGDDIRLPEQAIDQSFALGLGVANVDGWLVGLTLGAGYASADIYNDGNALYGKGTLAVGKALSEVSQLGIVLDYDGNRGFMPDVPLPGIQYRRQLDRRLLAAVGFPINSIQWKPDDRWVLELSYIFPDAFDASVGYRIAPQLSVFLQFTDRTFSFHWNELPQGHHRVFFEQKRAELGLRWSPTERFSLVLAGGFAFKQEFRTGWDLRSTQRLSEPDDTGFARFGFEFRF